MPSIVVPELVIHSMINSINNMLIEDITESTTKEETILYNLFRSTDEEEQIQLYDFSFVDQMIEMLRNRDIPVSMGYNLKILDSNIGVHILLPNETGKPINIGASTGYEEAEIDANQEFFFENKTMTTQSNYNVMITSPNSTLAIAYYHVLKSMFFSLIDNFEFYGLKNMNLGGNDVVLQQDMVPVHIFHRNINIGFEFDNTIRDVVEQKIIKKFKYKAVILNSN